jgi:hypothetical protein
MPTPQGLLVHQYYQIFRCLVELEDFCCIVENWNNCHSFENNVLKQTPAAGFALEEEVVPQRKKHGPVLLLCFSFLYLFHLPWYSCEVLYPTQSSHH